MNAVPSRFAFAEFVLSPAARELRRGGTVIPLIPRYFDLLVLLIERRPNVVTRREIFETVWDDVVVSDGALTQAVRTLRRALGDASREPVFIRTVSRHGYSFVYPDVVTGDEAYRVANLASATGAEHVVVAPGAIDAPPPAVEREALLARLRSIDVSRTGGLEDARDVAEQLHLLGTAEAVRGVLAQPGHADALAVLRETRWEVPGAGAVPLRGQPEGVTAAWRLARWRLREVHRLARRRWVGAAGAAAAAGVVAGLVGGALLVAAPGSRTSATAIPVLALLGALAGFAGACGVGAGMAMGEAVARSHRTPAIVAGGAVGGAAIGLLLKLIVGWTLASVFGLHVDLGGGTAGLALGAAVSAGYALTTRRPEGGMAALSGRARWRVAAAAGFAGAAAAVLLSAAGYRLVGGILHMVALESAGSDVTLGPLGAWIGETSFGPVTRGIVASCEGGLFGFGLAWGLSRRPGRPIRRS